MASRWICKLLIITASGLSLAGPCFAADTVTFNRPSAMFPAGDPVHGKELAAPCMACHSETETLAGDPPFHPPKLQHQRAPSLFYALEDYKSGQRKSEIMAPMVEPLSEQDMRDLSVYLAGKMGDPHQAALADSPGHAKVAALCGFCHGETGMGVMEGVPVLGGQHQDYLEHALHDYKSGARANATMRTIVRKLTAEDIEQITTYLSAQSSLEIVR